MRRVNKTVLDKKALSILRGNEGASLVLVTVIAIIIISSIIILRITVSSLWASSDKQYNQDRAYMMATSLGESLDSMITAGKISNLDAFQYSDDINAPYPVTAETNPRPLPDGTTGYELVVTATVGSSTYQYTAVYSGSGPYKRVS